MYREKVNIYDLLGAHDAEYREELLRHLGSMTRCPGRLASCSNSGQNCVACWANVLDHVEEVTIRCDV